MRCIDDSSVSVDVDLILQAIREATTNADAHKPLILLLQATDVDVLRCSIHALTVMGAGQRCRRLLGELNSVEVLLRILQDYDNVSKGNFYVKVGVNLLHREYFAFLKI